MAQLPSLNTDNISYISYLNVGSSVPKSELLETVSEMETHTEYDNGIDGTIGIGFDERSARFINCRVKDDGWIISWLDRRKLGEMDDDHGVHDLQNDWSSLGNIQPDKHNLERGIKRLYDAIPSTDNSNYNPTDVGLYNYEFEDAEALTLASKRISGNRNSGKMDLQKVDDTTIFEAYASGNGFASGSATWVSNVGTDNEERDGLGIIDVTDDVESGNICRIEFDTGFRLNSTPSTAGHVMILWG